MTLLTRRPSRILFWYIFREYLLPLCCCLCGFCIMFVIMDVFDDLDDFLQTGASVDRIAVYFLLRQPGNLVHVLPMSILLSVSFAMNNLGRHREVTAIRAAGVSVARCCCPVWIVAGVASVGLFVLSEFVSPFCGVRSEALRWELTAREGERARASARLAFRHRGAHRDWFFESFDSSGPQRGVSIKQFDAASGRLVWQLSAETARFDGGVWHFANGVRWQYAAEDLLPDSQESFTEIEVGDFQETPATIFNSLRPAEDLSILEMVRILRTNSELPPSTARVFRTTVWYRLLSPLSCVVASLFGVSMAVGRERAGALRGFASAVGLMLLYYMVSQGALLLGRYGILPAVLSGTLPPVGFIAVGIHQVYVHR